MRLITVPSIAVLAGIALMLNPVAAEAHNPLTAAGTDRIPAMLSALLLGAFWVGYVLGSRRVRPDPWRELLFHVTGVVAVFTLFGPLDDWAETSTAMHMTQHMLLMVVIAPLWVFARPLPQLAAAAGRSGAFLWKPFLQLAGHPLLAAYLHGMAIWFWHTPYFYMLAVDNAWWHAVEHACFLLTAGSFWWAVLYCTRRTTPFALLALLFTLMHTGFLGALLTFAQSPLYGEARDLQDQQLAGLIMWVVGAIPYLVASAWCGQRWYRRMVNAGYLGSDHAK